MNITLKDRRYSLTDVLQAPQATHTLFDFIQQLAAHTTIFKFHTSGSTGVPKSIDTTREQIRASVAATQDFLGLKSTDRALICLDAHFVASKMMAARAFFCDMDLHVIDPCANPFKNFHHAIDFVSLVPFQVYRMIEAGHLSVLQKVRNVLVGGAPLSAAAFDALAALPTNVYLSYGMTETAGHIALMPVKGNFNAAAYQLLKGIEMGTDAEGCLYIQGAVTQNERAQTHDVVKQLDPHRFQWLGRKDFVINSGGIKIHPELLEKEITRLLHQQGINIECFIGAVPHPELGSQCVMLTEAQEIPKPAFSVVQSAIQQVFSRHHAPKRALTLRQFIRTDSGKLKRQETLQNLPILTKSQLE